MFKKDYKLQIVGYGFFLMLFSGYCLLANSSSFAQQEKISKLMPRDTQLLSQKEDKSQEFVAITTYKYGSANKKAKILEFYRQLFKNEGYQELVGHTPEKQKAGPHMVYFFSRPNELAILSMTNTLEDGLNIYYIALNVPNVEAVKSLDIKEKENE